MDTDQQLLKRLREAGENGQLPLEECAQLEHSYVMGCHLSRTGGTINKAHWKRNAESLTRKIEERLKTK
jgi:hypothetical protein